MVAVKTICDNNILVTIYGSNSDDPEFYEASNATYKIICWF